MIRPIMPWKATGADCVTVLHAVDQRWTTVDDQLKRTLPRLTKLIREDGIEPYDHATWFHASAWQLDCVEELMELLACLEPQANACVIRGVLKSEFAAATAVRRRYLDGDGETAAFAPAARQWLMVEADAIPLPRGISTTDPELVGGVVRMALPTEFHSARAAVQLSSSAGFRLGLAKAHVWFWCDRAVSDAECRRWLAAAPVDLSVYQPVGIHYVAKPCFAGDLEDPCHERLALLPGYAEVAVPDLPDPERPRSTFAPAEFAAYAPPARGLGFKASRSERYMLASLRALAAARGGEGRVRCIQVALTLYGLAKAGRLDPAVVTGRLKGVMRDRGWAPDERTRGNTLADINRALEWAWDHAQPRTLP